MRSTKRGGGCKTTSRVLLSQAQFFAMLGETTQVYLAWVKSVGSKAIAECKQHHGIKNIAKKEKKLQIFTNFQTASVTLIHTPNKRLESPLSNGVRLVKIHWQLKL